MLRCCLAIGDKLVKERLQLLEEGERDKYLEKVSMFAETLNWICSELKQKALEMLEIEGFFE